MLSLAPHPRQPVARLEAMTIFRDFTEDKTGY
jgi:hypothetical protein